MAGNPPTTLRAPQGAESKAPLPKGSLPCHKALAKLRGETWKETGKEIKGVKSPKDSVEPS